MSSAPAKKANASATTGSARKAALTTGNGSSDSPSKSPTRTAVANGTGTASTPSINRARSVRTGAPPSARAAARKPADIADDDAKAELQAKLEDLQEQVRKAEEDATKAQQKATQLQVKLDEALKDQTTLEESVHEHLERINDLEFEKKESVRAKRELEQIFESERAAVIKEKEEQQEREEDLKATMQRLRETLAQKELRAGLDEDGRPGVQRNSSYRKSMTPSPNPDGITQFAPPASLERSDSRSSFKLVMQKDKIIEELRLELAEAQIRVVEVENIGGGRLQQLEKEMYNVKMQNARLMEENDSFTLLLREKTLNGDFSHSEILRPSSKDSASPGRTGGTLADELEATEEGEVTDEQRRHQAEVSSLKDTNKALTLYINNIISRLLEHGQFEQILDKTPDIFAGPNAASARYQQADKDKELPPPPPEKDQAEEPQGFLQRARSVMGGRAKRPMSQIIDNPPNLENAPPSLHENPQTAPQIPLGRSGHRRSNSDWGAASSIVNSMYRGPTVSTIANPASPGLSSPTTRTTGFFAPQPLSTGQRVPSGASVPTIPESGDDDLKDGDAPEQRPPPPPRDSKVTQSRDSVTSNADTTAGSEVLSVQSSPPRSQASSNEQTQQSQRDPRLPGAPPAASSVMTGSRMRPLRLVQENHGVLEDEAARKAANRGSWFGFLNKGA